MNSYSNLAVIYFQNSNLVKYKYILSISLNQHPTRSVENVALTMKGLQERKHNIEWDDGGNIGNKNK